MIWFIFIYFLSISQIVLNQVTDEKTYGPYNVEILKFESCKGPKRSECANVNITNTQNTSDIIFLIDLPNDCPLNKARVVISNKQNNIIRKLWNYELRSPCDHFVLGPILSDAFHLNRACRIAKGKYTVHLNMEEKSENFLGPKFFYGVYAFKVMVFNNKDNFFCVKTLTQVKGKNTTVI